MERDPPLACAHLCYELGRGGRRSRSIWNRLADIADPYLDVPVVAIAFCNAATAISRVVRPPWCPDPPFGQIDTLSDATAAKAIRSFVDGGRAAHVSHRTLCKSWCRAVSSGAWVWNPSSKFIPLVWDVLERIEPTAAMASCWGASVPFDAQDSMVRAEAFGKMLDACAEAPDVLATLWGRAHVFTEDWVDSAWSAPHAQALITKLHWALCRHRAHAGLQVQGLQFFAARGLPHGLAGALDNFILPLEAMAAHSDSHPVAVNALWFIALRYPLLCRIKDPRARGILASGIASARRAISQSWDPAVVHSGASVLASLGEQPCVGFPREGKREGREALASWYFRFLRQNLLPTAALATTLWALERVPDVKYDRVAMAAGLPRALCACMHAHGHNEVIQLAGLRALRVLPGPIADRELSAVHNAVDTNLQSATLQQTGLHFLLCLQHCYVNRIGAAMQHHHHVPDIMQLALDAFVSPFGASIVDIVNLLDLVLPAVELHLHLGDGSIWGHVMRMMRTVFEMWSALATPARCLQMGMVVLRMGSCVPDFRPAPYLASMPELCDAIASLAGAETLQRLQNF